MKKLLSVVVAGVLTFGLAACGGASGSAPSSAAAVDPSVSGSVSQASVDSVPAETASGDPTIEEQVLMDMDGITVTATGLDLSGMMGPELKVLVENNGEKAVTVQVRDCSVNGFMIEPMFSCDVQPGKKSNDSISFFSSDMEANGIDVIGTIELSFHVFDPETFDTLFDSDTVMVETSAAGDVPAAGDVEKTVIFEQDGIIISFVDFDTDDLFGLGIKFYIENNTETPITVQVRDSSINGFMLEGMMSADVMPGKITNTSLTFFETDLQDNGIESVEDVELKFHIFNKDTFDTIIDTDVITLNP